MRILLNRIISLKTLIFTELTSLKSESQNISLIAAGRVFKIILQYSAVFFA